MIFNKEKLKDINPYEKNPREHDENQIQQICKSIEEFGFTVPILIDENNTILAGHGRYYSAKKLGMKEVPTIKIPHLTPDQKKAYVIADNQLTINSNWNYDLLKEEIENLQLNEYDINLLGFEQLEITNILKKLKENVDLEEFEEFSEKIETKHECPRCGFKWSGNAN